MSDLAQVLEQTIASAECNVEWRPPFGEQCGIVVHKQKMVTVIPTDQWTNLVFAIHEHLKAVQQHRNGAEVKPKWERQECGCVKANLPRSGRVMIRCSRHRGKPSKRVLAHWEDGMVRRG